MTDDTLPTGSAQTGVRRRTRKRLVMVAGLAALLLGLGLGFQHFWYGRPLGAGGAGPPVPASLFTKPWTERPVFLVGLGDSVTAGFGASRGHDYFSLLALTPAGDVPEMAGRCLSRVMPRLSCTNLAISGSVSHEVLASQLGHLPTAAADVLGWVVLTTGGNDVIHNYGRTPPRAEAMYGATLDEAKPWIEALERRLDTIMVEVSRKFPGGCQIFLANIYDPTDGAGDIECAGLPPWPDGSRVLSRVNESIARCAASHTNVHLVNLHDAFLGHGIHCAQFWTPHYDRADPHYWYYTNLEDPNERGYDAIRRLFLLEMAKVSNP